MDYLNSRLICLLTAPPNTESSWLWLNTRLNTFLGHFRVEPCAAPVAPPNFFTRRRRRNFQSARRTLPPPKFLATAGANRRRGWKCDRRRKTVNDIFVDYVVNTLSFLDRLGVGSRVTVPPVTYLITQAGSMTPPNYLWLLLAQRCLSTCLRLHSWPWPDAWSDWADLFWMTSTFDSGHRY